MRKLGGFVISCAMGAPALFGTASHASVYTWTWERPSDAFIAEHTVGPNTYDIDDGQVNDGAGIFDSITAFYDSSTARLSWTVNFGGQPDGSGFHTTEGFWLVITPGALPSGPQVSAAQFFFDASGDDPILTAYGYNNSGQGSSFLDGAPAGGTQAPDAIFSSLNSPRSVFDLSVIQNVDGSSSMTFDIDAGSIIGHDPLYGSSEDWTGAAFADLIGVWMHSLTNVSSSYEEGLLSDFSFARHGWLDAENQVVPSPGAAALLGLAGLLTRRRRRA